MLFIPFILIWPLFVQGHRNSISYLNSFFLICKIEWKLFRFETKKSLLVYCFILLYHRLVCLNAHCQCDRLIWMLNAWGLCKFSFYRIRRITFWSWWQNRVYMVWKSERRWKQNQILFSVIGTKHAHTIVGHSFKSFGLFFTHSKIHPTVLCITHYTFYM